MLVPLPPLEAEGIQQQVLAHTLKDKPPNINAITNGNLRPEMKVIILAHIDDELMDDEMIHFIYNLEDDGMIECVLDNLLKMQQMKKYK